MAKKIIDVKGLMNILSSKKCKECGLAIIKKNREKKINEFAEFQETSGQSGPADGTPNWQSFNQEGRLIHELEKELAD
ncbi:hypothetical protein KAJ89_06115 [Candidatus Parcubacteria bacterium]|nr:hypothetical protein [Candidatus Parcubacteria bacterium]